MDKLYKPHFLSQLKARMPIELPEFGLHRVPKDHPRRTDFTASVLYLRQLPSQHCVWLDWFPGEGVEREFYAYLGWSLAPEVLPHNTPGDQRIHFLHEPSADVPTGALNVQQVKRRQAIAGFTIATPWDTFYQLSPRAPDEERKMVMDKAYGQYLAVTDVERAHAVRAAMDEAFRSITSVLPRFCDALSNIPHC